MAIEIKSDTLSFIRDARMQRELSVAELFSSPEIPWSTDALEVIMDSRHLNALDNIVRWKKNHIRTPEWFKETDKDHVLDMKSIFENEILVDYPHIATSLDRRKTILMIMSHDSEEILLGDLPLITENQQLQERKSFKEPIARKLLLRYIQEPAQSELRDITHRYHTRNINPFDREAHMTKWLDCIQSGRVSFNNGLYNTIYDLEDRNIHVFKAASAFINATQKAINAFNSLEEKNEIIALAEKERQRYISNGFGEIFARASSQLLENSMNDKN